MVPFLSNGPVVSVIVAMTPRTVSAFFLDTHPRFSSFYESSFGAKCKFLNLAANEFHQLLYTMIKDSDENVCSACLKLHSLLLIWKLN